MSMGHLQASTESLVVTAHTEEEGYGSSASSSAPELPTGVCETTASRLMRELFRLWQLDHERYGTPQWNPLADQFPKAHSYCSSRTGSCIEIAREPAWT